MTGIPLEGKMSDARTFFESNLLAWLRPHEEAVKERANAVVDAVRQDLLFVAIDLDNDDDGQLIFETLNSLGTPLLPSDLVKNLLFRQALSDGLNTDNLYAAHWEMFEHESDYWRARVAIGRRERTRLDVFLQFYLTLKLAREPVMTHQFREYRDAFRDGKLGTTVEALADFAYHAKLYQGFEQAKTGAAGNLRHVLEVLDSSVPNPLVLGFSSKVGDSGDRTAMLAILESYLMRRFLCGLGTKQYNRTIADLIAKLNDIGWSSVNFRSLLLGLEGQNSLWPTDEAVIQRQAERAAYGNIRGVGLSLALSRVEESMRTEKSEGGWNTRTPLTIEHLMPQKWEEHWPLADPSNIESKHARNDQVNWIGNLTVLTKKLNSSISNGSWETKKRHLNEHTVLLMNSSLATSDSWDEERIRSRSASLGRRFCKIWLR